MTFPKSSLTASALTTLDNAAVTSAAVYGYFTGILKPPRYAVEFPLYVIRANDRIDRAVIFEIPHVRQ